MPFVKSCLCAIAIATVLLSAAVQPALAASGEVNVYSYRQPVLIDPLFEAFYKKTGISVKYVFAKKGLIERLAQEGRNSPADIVLTADAGRLVEASQRGLTQQVTSPAITDSIPPALRDPDNQWFGLTMRARVLFVSQKRVSQTKFTYAELTDPKWKGRICVRSGGHPYNIGLIAAMIAHQGKATTRDWLTGLKANLARRPTGNERAQANNKTVAIAIAHRQDLTNGISEIPASGGGSNVRFASSPELAHLTPEGRVCQQKPTNLVSL